ncbi:MAG: hydrogenase expression/formation C-terminal domain-containing protein [Gammaproteobacteria bacterium]
MSGLSDIGVKVEGDSEPEDGPTTRIGNALPILHEIETYLTRLTQGGEPATIDLRAMPLAPGDYETLQRLLGEGEVSATIDALGPTRVRETAVRGVWWVTHHGATDEVVAEFIEITRIPTILQTVDEDLVDGLSRLRECLAQEGQAASD